MTALVRKSKCMDVLLEEGGSVCQLPIGHEGDHRDGMHVWGQLSVPVQVEPEITQPYQMSFYGPVSTT